METVNFYPKTFHEIPEQDNPAFGHDECLMIVGEANTHSNHAVVLHIVPDPVESVTSLAKFWLAVDAVDYCQMLSEKYTTNGA